MRSFASTWGRVLTGAATLFCCSIASAQFNGFNVRFINVTSEAVDNHTEALQMVGDPRTTPKAFSASFDGSQNYPTVNFAGGNNFSGDHDFPGGAPPSTDFNDFILYATAEVTIPAGEYAIGFGSDDGGQLTLEGLEMLCVVGCNEGGELPFDIDQIVYNGNRGHGWTIGELIVDSETTTQFNVSQHERGGGDSLEVAIVPLADFNGTGFDAGDGWELLGDGVLDWSVSTDKVGSFGVAGDGIGELFPSANSVQIIRGESPDTDFMPGLAQEWSKSGNAGGKLAIEEARFDTGVDPVAFRAADTDWWFGNVRRTGHLQDAGIPSYPESLESAGYAIGDAADNNDYSVRLTGEVNFENPGTYRFRDGVDDYTYFAVDTNGNGVAGDDPAEVLIDDNAWTDADGVTDDAGANASPLVSLEVADGETGWKAIEFLMAEGGGSDAGILYWNGLDFDNELLAEPGIAVDDADLLIPQSHTRSMLPGPVVGIESSAKLDPALEYVMQVSSELLDSDHIVFEGTLEVGGANIRVVADGELVPGDSWVLLVGTDIVGADAVNYVFDNPDEWDLSQLASTGRIIYAGSGAAASVPEPTSLGLLGLGGLILGLLRRRRK